jgi:hypothetical protein
MENRALRITSLLKQKGEIDAELSLIRQQIKEEKVALTANRKPRKSKGAPNG